MRIRAVAAATTLVVAFLLATDPVVVGAARQVTGADIKNNSITGQDVKNGSLLGADFAQGQLPAGATGATGATGAKGDAGPTGPTGPAGAVPGYIHYVNPAVNLGSSWTSVDSLSLPAGTYLLLATAMLHNPHATNPVDVTAYIDSPLGTVTQLATVAPNGWTPITVTMWTTSAVTITATLSVYASATQTPATTISHTTLWAIRLSDLTWQQ